LSSSISEYSPKVREAFDGISWKRNDKISAHKPVLEIRNKAYLI